MIGDAEGTVLWAQLVTPTSGWALTRTRLAWTGDGARSWRTITPRAVPAARVRGAFFLDQRTGWVVASARTRETGSQVQLAVYRTADAGATWSWSSLGTLDLGGDDAAGGYEGGGVLAQPSFVDHRNGWVSVLTSSSRYKAHRFLFRTTDGGATWTRLLRPPDVQRAVLSSPTRGWAVVMGHAAATSGQGRGTPGLYTTADAGRQWQRVGLVPPPSLRGISVQLREPPTFKTARDGYLPVEFFERGGGRPRLLAVGFYVTADGGATWSPRYAPLAEADEEHGLVPLTAADRRTLVALVGHEARKVLTSRDGGHAWTTGATGLEGRYPVVRGLAFADPAPAGRSPAAAPALTSAATRGRPAATTAASCCAPPTAAAAGRRRPRRVEPPRCGKRAGQHPMATVRARQACTMRTGESRQIGSTNQLLGITIMLSKLSTQAPGMPSSLSSGTSEGMPRTRLVAGTTVILRSDGMTAWRVMMR